MLYQGSSLATRARPAQHCRGAPAHRPRTGETPSQTPPPANSNEKVRKLEAENDTIIARVNSLPACRSVRICGSFRVKGALQLLSNRSK